MRLIALYGDGVKMAVDEKTWPWALLLGCLRIAKECPIQAVFVEDFVDATTVLVIRLGCWDVEYARIENRRSARDIISARSVAASICCSVLSAKNRLCSFG